MNIDNPGQNKVSVNFEYWGRVDVTSKSHLGFGWGVQDLNLIPLCFTSQRCDRLVLTARVLQGQSS